MVNAEETHAQFGCTESVQFIMEFHLKWVYIARYVLIYKLDGAPWLRIIFGPQFTQIMLIKYKTP